MRHRLNIGPIVRKEFRQIRRDKRTLGVLLVIPAMMVVLFGYALNFDVKHTTVGVCDEDRTKASRELTGSLFVSEFFDQTEVISDRREVDGLIDRERIHVALVIPRGFSERLERGQQADIQVIVDGSNSTSATMQIGYINGIIQQYSISVLGQTVFRKSGRSVAMPIDFQPRIWYNPELRSARYLVPGLIAFILMVVAVVSTSMSIVREIELGTMEQLKVSPVRPIELILGKTIPYVLISLFAALSIIVLGYLLFGVEVRGSILQLFVVCSLFLMSGLGFGLLISTIAETQQVAFMLAVITTMLPTFLLSGFVFPIRNMPLIVQAVTMIIPARYFLVALRSIVLKGVGITAFWDQFLYLGIYAFVILGASTVRLRRKLR